MGTRCVFSLTNVGFIDGLLENYYMQGFAPADEVPSMDSGQALLFRPKDPTPVPPVRGPSGASASAQDRSFGFATHGVYSEPFRRTQTALAKEVDSVLRLRRAQRGLR